MEDDLSNKEHIVSDEWPEELKITDPQAIALLSNRKALTFLMPFLRAEHTLTSAADVMGKQPSTVAYWIPRFVRAGLIIHRGDEQRAGRAMPRYRGAARHFLVPFRLLPFEGRVALLDGGRFAVMNKLLDGVDEQLEKMGDFGLRFSAPAEGGVAVETSGDQLDAKLPVTDSWFRINLTEQDATDFATRLAALYDEYADRGGPIKYYGHVGLAREPRHAWRSAEPHRS
ncbi:MAG: hypothetical protein ABIR32_14885 [Ilumatobacteraceae bacterium]